MFASLSALDMLDDACPGSSASSNPARKASSCTAPEIFSVQATTSISRDATAAAGMTSARESTMLICSQCYSGPDNYITLSLGFKPADYNFMAWHDSHLPEEAGKFFHCL